jgi:hypothetical protein
LGGCDRSRTCDPCLAKAVLYQLSYAPIRKERKEKKRKKRKERKEKKEKKKRNRVGYGRFELPTSPLSGVRSNQLS